MNKRIYVLIAILLALIVFSFFYKVKMEVLYFDKPKYQATEELLFSIPFGAENGASTKRDSWGRLIEVICTNKTTIILKSRGENYTDMDDDIVVLRVYSPDIETFLKNDKDEDEVDIEVYQKSIFNVKNAIYIHSEDYTCE